MKLEYVELVLFEISKLELSGDVVPEFENGYNTALNDVKQLIKKQYEQDRDNKRR